MTKRAVNLAINTIMAREGAKAVDFKYNYIGNKIASVDVIAIYEHRPHSYVAHVYGDMVEVYYSGSWKNF